MSFVGIEPTTYNTESRAELGGQSTYSEQLIKIRVIFYPIKFETTWIRKPHLKSTDDQQTLDIELLDARRDFLLLVSG